MVCLERIVKMAKVIKTLAADGIDFDDICSFKTENYIGIFDYSDDEFILIRKEGNHVYLLRLSDCCDLQDLDDLVYKLCEEHIQEVFDTSDYEFILKEG